MQRYTILFFGIIALTLAGWACGADGQTGAKANSEDGHAQMIAILKEVAKTLYNPANVYSSEARLAECDAMLATEQDPGKRLEILFRKAQTLIEYGDEKSAVTLLEQMMEALKSEKATRASILPVLGLAYLRLAERNNCITSHSADACILPIQGLGVHQDKSPARKAIQSFEELLSIDPENYDARWLVNILYMTVGEYEQKKSSRWYIPGLDKEGSAHHVKPFTDMAADLKINVHNRSGGVIIDDFNRDGYLDIVSSAWGLDDPMHYFKNRGDGTFEDISKSSRLSEITGGLNLVQTDYNNDGYLDIFVLRGAWQGQSGFGKQPNSLLRNNGDDTFTDVTIEAGLLSYLPTQTATWNDFNNDGHLDLFIGNESYSAKEINPCELYINDGKGKFTNIAGPNTVNISVFVKGVVSGDYNNDGWVDIFISSLSGHKILLKNKGVSGPIPEFENVTDAAGLGNNKSHTFPTWFFDYDNDGFLDIFFCDYDFDRNLSYYAAREALHPSNGRQGKVYIYKNKGDGTFTETSSKMGLNQIVFPMGSNFGDIDNDGYLDMYLATGNPSYFSLIPNKLYKNLGGKDFADVTVSGRVGNLQKGHGVAFADLNNNGDQDIYAEMGGALRGDAYYSSFYLNPGQSENNWICIELEGVRSNRAAIGAKVTVKFRENGVERMVYREVNSGGSFGASPLRREIGVGLASEIDEILVEWPASGVKQSVKNIKPNQFIRIKEGAEGFEKLQRKSVVFKKSDGSMPMCRQVDF